jgi:acyl carrier protein phosphodiesterase
MNFLAHAHLSFGEESILVGNLIADAVKGKQFFSFSDAIRQGILLHRKIDVYTDAHPVVRHSRQLIYDDLSRYSGVAVDIYYDHFLALHWSGFCTIPLDEFTLWVYRVLGKNQTVLPAKTRRILPYMIAQNWLHAYANPNELKRVFRGMDRRTGDRSGLRFAMGPLEKHYNAIKEDFMAFYPALCQYAVTEKALAIGSKSNKLEEAYEKKIAF